MENMVMTGLAALDDATGGFWPGSLVLVAGRPNSGRTALVISTALTNAKVRPGTLLVAPGMDEREASGRICAAALRRPVRQCMCMGTSAWAKVVQGTMAVDCGRNPTVEDVRQKCSSETTLICADFLELVRPKRAERDLEIDAAQVVLELRGLAGKIGAVAMLITGVPRDARPGLAFLKPGLADLADTVLWMVKEKADEVEVGLLKGRGNGGVVRLPFDTECAAL